MADEVWQLCRGKELIAELIVVGTDQPWLRANVRATPNFANARPLFDEELARLDSIDADYHAWEAAQQRLQDEFRLVRPDGAQPAEFLLHVDGDEAWWRWSDESLPEPGVG